MRSLRARLLAGIAVLVIGGLVLADVATYAALDTFLVSRLDAQLVSQGPGAAAAVLGLRGRPGPGNGVGSSQAIGGLPSGTYFALYSPGGALMGEGVFDPQIVGSQGIIEPAARPRLPTPLPDAGPDRPTVLFAPGTGGGSFRVLVESIDGFNGDYVVVAVPLAEVSSTLHQLLWLEVVIGSLVLSLVVLLAHFTVRAGLRPLERMGQTAAAIATGELGRRIEPAEAGTEIGRLGLALNSMLSQIEAAFAQRTKSERRLKRFVADAGHELRTPLSSIRGYAELLRRAPRISTVDAELARGRIEDEAIRMGDLVDDLLLLARLDQGRPLDLELVDLSRITAEVRGDVAVTAAERTLALQAPEPVPVLADQMRLRQVVSNLVRNAVVHTPAGTAIEIGVGRQGDRAELLVVDHGPGLSDEARERVFEPFYRADPARSRDRGGSGLGLSIASGVVAALGGRIEVLQTPGGGATFRVELPLARPPGAPDQARSASELDPG